MRVKSVIAILVLFGWLGCSDSTNDNNNSNTLTGDLTGKISLADYRGAAKADKSGVLVQLDGTPYSTITDTAGVWTIHNLPSRTYSLTFSKPGCDTWIDRSYSFIGGGVVRYKYVSIYYSGGFNYYIVPIRELPRYTINLDVVILPKTVYSDSAKTNIYVPGGIYGHTSNDAPPSGLSAYFISGSTPTLSTTDKSSFRNSYSYRPNSVTDFNFYTHSSQDTVANLNVTYFSYLTQGFSSGDTVYFRVYPCIGEDSYYDAIEDKTVDIGYSNNGSNILSAVMP